MYSILNNYTNLNEGLGLLAGWGKERDFKLMYDYVKRNDSGDFRDLVVTIIKENSTPEEYFRVQNSLGDFNG